MSDNNIDIFDEPGVLERVDNDLDLYFEVFGVFIEDYPAIVETLREGVQLQDFEKIWTAAHTLKSAVGNLGGLRCFELARQLETAGREQKAEFVERDFEKLEYAIVEFIVYMNEYKEKNFQ